MKKGLKFSKGILKHRRDRTFTIVRLIYLIFLLKFDAVIWRFVSFEVLPLIQNHHPHHHPAFFMSVDPSKNYHFSLSWIVAIQLVEILSFLQWVVDLPQFSLLVLGLYSWSFFVLLPFLFKQISSFLSRALKASLFLSMLIWTFLVIFHEIQCSALFVMTHRRHRRLHRLKAFRFRYWDISFGSVHKFNYFSEFDFRDLLKRNYLFFLFSFLTYLNLLTRHNVSHHFCLGHIFIV